MFLYSDSASVQVGSDLERMVSSGAEIVCPPGKILVRQGCPGTAAFWISDGTVKLIRSEVNGASVIVGLMVRPDIIGLSATIVGSVYPTTAVTVTRASVRLISRTELIEAVENGASRGCVLRLLEYQASQEYHYLQRFGEVACLSARTRLEYLLADIAAGGTAAGYSPDKAQKLRLPLREWEIAEALAVTPAHLSRLIARLEEDGILYRDKGWLVLLRPALSKILVLLCYKH